MIKKIFLTFLLLTSVWAFAQVPQGINYQGVARDNSGNALANTTISVQFTILQSGTSVFSETKNLTTDTFGLYTHVIGSVSTGQFTAINWAGGNLSIQIGIDPTGGSSYTTVATSVLQSVPYALYAGSSGNTATTQSLSISSNTLSISGGNSVTLPASTDAQTLTINSNTLSIANGNSVVLPAQTTYTAGMGIDITGGVISNTATAVTPTITGTGATSVTGTYPTLTINTPTTQVFTAGTGIDITSGTVSNTAPDQTVTINGAGTATVIGTYPTFTISTPTISALPTPQVGSILYSDPSSTWTATDPTRIFSDGTNIGIGTSSPNAKIDINTSPSYTGTVVNLNSTATGGGSPVLQVTSNSSNGYGIEVDNLNGAAIVANSQGPYAVNGNITGGSGNAMEGDILNGAHGNAVAGYVDNNNSMGSAGYFENKGSTNDSAVLKVVNTPANAGYSGAFSGGRGLSTDSISISAGNTTPGYILTSNGPNRAATWQSASVGSNWSTSGNAATVTDFIGTTNANTNPLIFKTNGTEAMRIDGNSQSLGIGTGATSLVSQLDVSGNIHTNTGKILFGNVGGIDDGYTGIYGGSGLGDLVLAVFKPSSSGSVGTIASYDAVTIKGTSGNVGIGTTTPSALLDIQAGSNVAVNILNAGDIPALVVNASAGSGNNSATFAGGTGVATDNLTNGNMITTTSLTVNDGFHLSLNPNLGQVLTSDNFGNGTWQPIPAQTLSLASNVLSISGGNAVTLPSSTDAQTLTINSNTLSISNGNTVTLPNSTVTVSAPLTGNGLSGTPITLPTVTTATTVGSATQIPTFSVDVYGRVSNASNIAITGLLPTGANGQTLLNNGSSWVATSNLFNDGTNIGIGTTTPNNLIQVNGLVNFDDSKTSTSLGRTAGAANTGVNNTFVGYAAGTANTSGTRVAYFGYMAGSAATGSYNAFFGAQAGFSTTTSTDNTFIGYHAGSANVNGYSNTYVGSKAGGTGKGNGNVFVGDSAGYTYTTGSKNIIIGYAAGTYTYATNTGSNNILIGAGATANAAGYNNVVALGTNAIVTGSNIAQIGGTGTNSLSVSFAGALMPSNNAGAAGQILTSQGVGAAPVWANPGGSWALGGNLGTTAGTNFIGTGDNVDVVFKRDNLLGGMLSSNNISWGVNALAANTSGANNTATGNSALNDNTTGGQNTANGYNSLFHNTIGSNNTAYGGTALWANVAGSNATAIGVQAMFYANNTSTAFTNSNVAVGYQALYGSTTASANTGNQNTALGYQTLFNNTSGNQNTATGNNVLFANTTGQNNTAYGSNALSANTGGSNNTAIGKNTLASNIGGSYNTAIGYGADVSGNLINATAIGYSAIVGASNSMVLGGLGTNSVNVGIGTSNPGAVLDIQNASTLTTLNVATSGIGNSGKFTGGAGLQTDKFQMTNTSGTAGAVLTATNTTGGAAWIAPVNFAAYAVNSQGISTGSTTQIISFPNIQYLNGGSLAAGVYTAPVTGIYHIDAAVSLANSFSSPVYIRLYVNGAEVKEVQYGSAAQAPIGFAISGDVSVISGQTIDIRIFSTSTAENTAAVAAGTTVWFNGHLVR